MSASEIANNKWESSSTKPPVFTAIGLAQVFLMSIFGLFFAYILIMSLVAIVTPKGDSALEQQYKEKLGGGGEAEGEEKKEE